MLDRIEAVRRIRKKLKESKPSIGSWMQIPHASIAEIMGQAGYDWVAIDLEHGAISCHQLPDLFRALELGETLPLVRLAQGHPKDCKQALDAGAGGVIVPMVESAEQLKRVRDACCWPPAGSRGVGFSRANLFGKYFKSYTEEAQSPLLVAMIEDIKAVKNLPEILTVEGLDAILVGPYDLSASMKRTALFEHPEFIATLKHIYECTVASKITFGIHVVLPDELHLTRCIDEGYRFIAYSIDAVFLNARIQNPIVECNS